MNSPAYEGDADKIKQKKSKAQTSKDTLGILLGMSNKSEYSLGI